MRLWLVVLVATGCTRETTRAIEKTPDVMVGPPACAVSTTAPEAYAATLRHDDQPGIDCFTSSWDGTFEFGYAHGWLIHLAVPRALNGPGKIDLAGGTVGLFYQGSDWSTCSASWKGSLVWADSPDWSVVLEASCADDPATRVVGSWSGSGSY